MTKHWRRVIVALTTAAATLAFAAAGLAQGVTPQTVTLELEPGESATVTKEVETTRLPPASDFVFLADTTGSMGPSIDDVKANAQLIIDAIEGAGATDARYAVANYRDTTAGFACDYLDELDANFTDATGAKAAINTWTPGGGCDTPEGQFYALHQIATSELGLSWRTDSAKFVIWFGDAPGHDPICELLPGYSDAHPSINEAMVIADLIARGARVIAVSTASGPGLDADPKPLSFDYPPPCAADEQGNAGQATRIAAATGGVHLINPPGASLADTIVDAIEALPPVPVTVTPVANCDAGLVVTNMPPTQVVPSGSTATFTETITLTATTAGAMLTCTVDFLINGSNAGPAYRQTITVRVVPGPPATLVLTPPTDTNTVDDQHCVTATVRDAFGNPTPGITVRFAVSGSVTTTGSAVTNAAGQATFCYTGPALPGADTITAYADTDGDSVRDPNEPEGRATKTWVVPTSTEGCKVTGGGRIVAANGDKATFGGNAKGDGPSGQEQYQDHGPAMDLNVHSIEILAVTCSADGTSASIFGTATVNGAGSFDFRIDVKDLGEPGDTDRYRIRLSNGYDSGDQQLVGGNIQIHS
ncbi:MAG TPA: post-COAP-1 domain-containing protein [Actinomycetota bacterium]